jgi:cytochrome P450
MTTTDLDAARTIFTDPTAYADMVRWHEAADRLRRETPVALIESEGFRPFRALTRHADVLDVSRRSDVFTNTRESVLMPDFMTEFLASVDIRPQTLIHMDGRTHRDHRRITAEWFRPRAAASWQPDIERIADEFAARLDSFNGRCDLAQDIAKPFALRVIMSIFGVPEEDEDLMLELTQGLFGAGDPEYLGDLSDPADLIVKTIQRFGAYFATLAGARRADPTDDLATVIANGAIEGHPLGADESLWYFIIVATAGHDTTSFALTGGIEALLRHPDQLEELRRHPDLGATATEEIIRWTSPVYHFLRYAQVDTEVGGHPIAAGERVLLSYPAANRDPAVFTRPHEFDIARPEASDLISFGVGVHHCLGHQFARREIRAMLPRLLARISDIELDGEPEWSETAFVGGVKHLPVNFRLAD